MTAKKTIRATLTAIILGTLAALWGCQSDLAYNVAQQRAILLGRYTLDKTSILLVLTPILLLVLKRIWTPKNPDPRARLIGIFKGITLTLSILFAIIFVDVAMRITAKKDLYIRSSGASYHRTPNIVYNEVFHDRPEFAFSYPNALPGYPEVPYTLTVDSLGFRNAAVIDKADWLVVGDSFAEGSSVSDEQVWVTQLAEHSNKSIYNLGMSGGSPLTYHDVLQKFGLDRHPDVVLYMLYEGNDFRDSNYREEKLTSPEKNSNRKRPFKSSPLRALIKDSLRRGLGPIGSKRFANDPNINKPNHRMYPVAWLPLQVPANSGYGYTFDVKQLKLCNQPAEEFEKTKGCSESLRLLGETQQLCEENNIKLIVIYAPDKAHMLMDDVLEQVPGDQLKAFMATRSRHLPEPDIITKNLRQRADAREQTFQTYCQKNKIPFISLTQILREKTRQGVRTYYTYDQHWTPEGHSLVANYLNKQLSSID